MIYLDKKNVANELSNNEVVNIHVAFFLWQNTRRRKTRRRRREGARTTATLNGNRSVVPCLLIILI